MGALPPFGPSDLDRACPCCGYSTLTTRGEAEICLVCWWQDDGSDTATAGDLVEDSPNENVTLEQARKNFLQYGTAFPERRDLLAQDPSPYSPIRTFKLRPDGSVEETTPAPHRN